MLGRIAVRTVKPVLSDAAWQWLRHLNPRAAQRDRARAERVERAELEQREAAERAARRAAERAAALAAQHEREVAALIAEHERLTAEREQQAAERDRLAAADLTTKSLTHLAEHFGTDKWGRHRYTPHYERHLGPFKQDVFTLLELGIGGYSRAGQGGASLRMWKNYFPRAEIVGLDIEDKSFVVEDRIRAVRGSQVDPEVLQPLAAQARGGLRVVIDDGSHENEHVVESFRILFPMLAHGGVYVIEDTQTAYWEEFGGSADLSDPSTSMNMVKSLLDGLNYEEYTPPDYQPSYTEMHVVAVHAYHNLVFIEKGKNNEELARRTGRAIKAAERAAELAASRVAPG